MKFNICPRCSEKYFEKLKTYAFCHSCDFNTVEAYTWNPRERATRRSVKYGRPVDLGSICKEAKSAEPLFTEIDYAVVQRALLDLPANERLIVLLRFWDRHDVQTIAYHLGLRVRSVEVCLDRAYDKIKNFCLRYSEFSRTQSEILKVAA